MKILFVFLGGGLGSVLRFAIGFWVKTWELALPWATLISNVVASLILAIVWNYSEENSGKLWVYPLLAIGFCGGLSTFSTFSLETVQLMRQGQWLWALINVAISTGLCLLIVYRLTRQA
jgi:fluoride exporter